MLVTFAQLLIVNCANKIIFALHVLVPTSLKIVGQLANALILALILRTIYVFVLVVPLNIMAIVILAQLLLVLHANKIMFALLV